MKRKIAFAGLSILFALGSSLSSSAYSQAGYGTIKGSVLTCPGGGVCFDDGIGIHIRFTPGRTYTVYGDGGGRTYTIYSATAPEGGDEEFIIEPCQDCEVGEGGE